MAEILEDIKPPPPSNLASNSTMKPEPGFDNNNVGENGSGSCNFRMKIDELERQLREEKESFALFKSESALQKIGACQEVEKCKRACLGLQENVGRLEEDCKTLYERCAALNERETRDRERIKGLVAEIEKKDGEFKQKIVELNVENRDLECAKRRALEEAHEWKKKYEEIRARELRLVDEIFRLKNGKGKNPSSRSREEGSDRMGRSCVESLFVVIDSEGEGEGEAEHVHEDEDDEEDGNRVGKPKKKIRIITAVDGVTNTKPLAPENVTKEVLGASGNAKSLLNVANGDYTLLKKVRGPRLKKKFKPYSRGFSPNARMTALMTARKSVKPPVSPDHNRVANTGRQSYSKRNFCVRPCAERTAPSDRQLCAEKRAEILQSKLKSCNPSFIKSMIDSNDHKCFYWLGLPYEFCKKNLTVGRKVRPKMVLEDERGLEYNVMYIGERNGLSGGWRRFALAHHLELGDALIFELCGPRRFKVYIIRANLELIEDDSDDWASEEDVDLSSPQKLNFRS